MSDNAGRSWWRGSSAGDSSATTALRARLSTGTLSQLEASNHLDELLLNATLLRGKIWTLPASTQTVALGWWLTLMYWQCAGAYVANVASDTDQVLSRQVLQQSEALCRQAEDWTVQAIGNQSRAEVGTQLPALSAQALPALAVDLETYPGVWAVFEIIYLQVQTDLNRILSAQVPKRFRPVLEQLQNEARPSLALYEHYQQNWMGLNAPSARMENVARALEPIRTLFKVGQQLWAPYLLGRVYATCLRQKPGIEDLELGFDPWVLTDSERRQRLQGDTANEQQLTAFWESLASPANAFQLQQQLDAAVRTHRIRQRTGKGYNIVPWPAQYLVRYAVTLGRRSFVPGDLIALFVDAGESNRTIEVRRTGRVTDPVELLGQ